MQALRRGHLEPAADALLALLQGDQGEAAEAGALVLADAIHCLHIVRAFLTKKG